MVSRIDIALWDIRGKVLGQPVYDLLGGKVRDDILLYTHPDSRNFGTDEGVVKEIRAIVDFGHTALKFDPFPHENRIGAADDSYLDGGMSKQGEKAAARLTARIREIAGPDIEILIDAHGRFNVPTAIRLCRVSRRRARSTGSRSRCPWRAITRCIRCERRSAPI